MFVQLNADLMLLRRGLLSQFNAKFTPLVHALLDKTLEFSYKASFKERNTEEMLVYLQENVLMNGVKECPLWRAS